MPGSASPVRSPRAHATALRRRVLRGLVGQRLAPVGLRLLAVIGLVAATVVAIDEPPRSMVLFLLLLGGIATVGEQMHGFVTQARAVLHRIEALFADYAHDHGPVTGPRFLSALLDGDDPSSTATLDRAERMTAQLVGAVESLGAFETHALLMLGVRPDPAAASHMPARTRLEMELDTCVDLAGSAGRAAALAYGEDVLGGQVSFHDAEVLRTRLDPASLKQLATQA